MSFEIEFKSDSPFFKFATDSSPKYTMMHTFRTNGIEHYQMYKDCTFTTTKARCQCGFTRRTKKGLLNKRQIDDIKNHVKDNDHNITLTHEMSGRKA